MKTPFTAIFLLFSVLSSSAEALQGPGLRPVDPEAARRGFEFIARKAYVEGGMNSFMFNNLWRAWEPELKAKARKASPKERRKMLFERYGLFETPYDNGGVPMGFVKGKLGLWSNNCLACHGGSLMGKPMVGLANTSFDLKTFVDDANALLRQKGDPDHWLNHSAGTTNAFQFSVDAIAKRDKDLNLVKDPRSFPEVRGADLDAPPWWNVKYKERLYSDGFTPVSPRAMMQFAVASKHTGETIRSWLPDFEDILQWIDSLEAPLYPGPVDSGKALRGQMVFAQSCAHCHGNYEAGGRYPGKTIALKAVGTDPVRVLFGLTPDFRAYYRDGWLGDYGKEDIRVEPKGYVAPPLHGVWASAPYFHNGSVPTLWHVLHSAQRPTVWKVRDRDAYDHARMGLSVQEFSAVPTDLRYGFEKRRYFDTSSATKSKEGHLFPDALSEVAKDDVLEYLKTL
jgi:mono/diheme cytochrome c family protein